MTVPAIEPRSRGAELDRTARLQRIFSENYRVVWRVVRRIGLPVEASDDAAQQVFLIAAERLDDIAEGSERAFVFGTALRVARTFKRRLARELPSEEGDRNASPLPRPDELADQKRAREVLDAVLQELPADLRAVFILFELEGLTTPEIAELFEIPVGTAASRLRRAREKFRERVKALVDHRVTNRGTP